VKNVASCRAKKRERERGEREREGIERGVRRRRRRADVPADGRRPDEGGG